MLIIKKKRLAIPAMYLSSIADRLYGVIVTLYIFSHTALGWNADYTAARRMCTAAYIAASLILAGHAVYNRKALLTIRYTLIWGAGFLFMSFLSCIGSPEPGLSLRNLIRISINFFFIFILDYKIKDWEGLRKILHSVVAGAVLAGMYVLASSGINGGEGRLGHHEAIGNIVNLLSHMSAFAIVLNLYSVIESFSDKKRIRFLFYAAVEVFLFYIVLRTGSRTGMIIVVLGAALTVFLYTETRKKPFYILAGIAVCVTLFLQLSKTALFQTLYKISFQNLYHFFITGKAVSETSLNIRFEMILKGLELWLEKPLSGWGMGTFSELAGYHMYSHCDYAELLSGTGLAGTLFYYSIIIFSMIRLFRIKKAGNAGISVAAASGLAILVSNFSAVTYNSLLMLMYMLFIYKAAVLERENGLFRVHGYIV